LGKKGAKQEVFTFTLGQREGISQKRVVTTGFNFLGYSKKGFIGVIKLGSSF